MCLSRLNSRRQPGQQLQSLDHQIKRRISAKIEELAENPRPSGVKKFQGEANHWRIRVGDHRIIYRIDGQRVVVAIVRIAHRREVYR
jgi:mRNA interferase RelE/StbE